MADKLLWLNKHFVLLRYRTLQAAVTQENYKLPPTLEELARTVSGAEDFLWLLNDRKQYKDACDFMAYILHRRGAVWWAYECVVDLCRELELAPAVERDIAEIGAPKPLKVPDFVTEPPPVPPELQQNFQKMDDRFDQMASTAQELKQLIPPNVQSVFDEYQGIVDDLFVQEYGMKPDEILEKLIDQAENSDLDYFVDPDSPIFQEADKLENELEKVRKETVDLIKKAIPPKVPEHELKLRANALQAAYRWVVAPDEINAQKAMDVGNSCPDTPAGLLALIAFWSYGNLTPVGDQVIPTPPGLAANGIVSLLLMLALHQGGTRKFDERYERYFNLGLEIAFGERNWDESVESKIPPHGNLAESFSERTSSVSAPVPASPDVPHFGPDVSSVTAPPPVPAEGKIPYKRWKPNLPN